VSARSKWLAVAAMLAAGALVPVNPEPAIRSRRALPRPMRTHSEPRATRASSARVSLAASQFLDGYLPYLHGRRAARSIASATPALLAGLAGSSPIVSPAMRVLTPSVVSLTPAGELKVTATVNDGELASYQFTLRLQELDGRLLVTSVEGAQ
jgi:hypothetical protein